MQSDSSDVRNLVATLTPLIKKCNKMVTNDVRSAMFGFQGMHSSSKEVNEFIGMFAGTYSHAFHITAINPYCLYFIMIIIAQFILSFVLLLT